METSSLGPTLGLYPPLTTPVTTLMEPRVCTPSSPATSPHSPMWISTPATASWRITASAASTTFALEAMERRNVATLVRAFFQVWLCERWYEGGVTQQN